jgi:hypothetical protein
VYLSVFDNVNISDFWLFNVYYVNCAKINIMNSLSKTDTIIISALPVKFTKKEAENIFKSLGLTERYFENFTRKKCFNQYYNRIFHGVYERIITT